MTVETLGIPQLVKLPREGYELFYNDDRHAYQRVNPKGKPGKRYTSASTIAQAMPDRKEGLLGWVEKVTLEGVSQLVNAGVKLSDNPHGIRLMLERNALRYEQVRDAAGLAGTDIHRKMLEALARGEEIPDLAVLEEEQRGKGQGVIRWWTARKPKPIAFEQVVLSLKYEFAGRLDLLCEIDGEIVLVDLKTSRYILPKDHAQVALYAIGSAECGVGKADRGLIVQVFPDGKFREHECCVTEREALLALRIHRAKNRIDGRIRALAA